ACYLFLADTTKALSDYNKAISLNRFDPEGYVRRGRLYSVQGDYQNALNDINRSIELDSTNTFAYFNRAIIHYEEQKYKEALKDMDLVLRREPGNALTLYNRSLIYAQLEEYMAALDDMDRVLNINPNNVLAYFNRASIFISMGRYRDARNDYTRAIELYPDFAKAYLNRSYVNNLLGRTKESEKDYNTAQQKIAAYKKTTGSDPMSFADTTKKYSSLIALDADFAKSGFDNELLQYRDIDIRLKPLYRFVLASPDANVNYALSNRYESRIQSLFIASLPVDVTIASTSDKEASLSIPSATYIASLEGISEARRHFLSALANNASKQYNFASSQYDKAVETASAAKDAQGEPFFKAFYLMNRGTLKADMIELVSKFESNVRTLTMEDSNLSSTRVSDNVTTV
ncbi:MAG: tetratricopeptide repeat protein, partial [Bacteroidales bacterium]|nr:tetratricopeptide repeat protein [Bacteroidales bacterium]